MLLVLSIAVLAGNVMWSISVFDTVARGGIIGSSVSSTTEPVFNQSSLDTVRTIFANRAAEESKYETGAYQYPDPSQ